MYSGKPAASVVVDDLEAAAGLAPPEGRRALNDAGRLAVTLVAERIAHLVDDVLDRRQRASPAASSPAPSGGDPAPPSCSCRSRRGPA
jgi:hypothetical protein